MNTFCDNSLNPCEYDRILKRLCYDTNTEVNYEAYFLIRRKRLMRIKSILLQLSTAGRAKPIGFTIVELLIVVVIIAILASITVVAYTGVANRAKEGAVKNDLNQAAKKLENYKTLDANASYPVNYTTVGVT
jgi:prepilin-type N-terminal cleavage/methylation domain-containing protein